MKNHEIRSIEVVRENSITETHDCFWGATAETFRRPVELIGQTRDQPLTNLNQSRRDLTGCTLTRAYAITKGWNSTPPLGLGGSVGSRLVLMSIPLTSHC